MASKRKKSEELSSSSSDSESDSNASQKEDETNDNDPDAVVQEKEQVYEKLNTKVEVLDCLFHPTEPSIIALGLINGKLKM